MVEYQIFDEIRELRVQQHPNIYQFVYQKNLIALLQVKVIDLE
jgi:hypothetical protein